MIPPGRTRAYPGGDAGRGGQRRGLAVALPFAERPHADLPCPYYGHAAECSPSPERERAGVRAVVPPTTCIRTCRNVCGQERDQSHSVPPHLSADQSMVSPRLRTRLCLTLDLTHTLVLFLVSGHGARIVGHAGTDQQNKSKIMSMIKSKKAETTPSTARRSRGLASAGFRSPTWRGHSKNGWAAPCRSPGRGVPQPGAPAPPTPRGRTLSLSRAGEGWGEGGRSSHTISWRVHGMNHAAGARSPEAPTFRARPCAPHRPRRRAEFAGKAADLRLARGCPTAFGVIHASRHSVFP